MPAWNGNETEMVLVYNLEGSHSNLSEHVIIIPEHTSSACNRISVCKRRKVESYF